MDTFLLFIALPFVILCLMVCICTMTAMIYDEVTHVLKINRRRRRKYV